MEDVLIYDIESQNNEPPKSAENNDPSQWTENNDSFNPYKKPEKDTQISSLATKTIKIRSTSSQDSPQSHNRQEHTEKEDRHQQNIIFYQQDLSRSQSSIDVDSTTRGFIKSRLQMEEDDEDSDEYQDQVQELQQLKEVSSERQTLDSKRPIIPPQTILKNKSVLVTANVDLLIKQVVPIGYKLTCYLQISHNILGFASAYRLFLGEQRQFLMSAKKETFKYYSSFIISRHHKQIHKRSQVYIGRLESNFVGTEFQLFSVKEQLQTLRLTVEYNKNIVGFMGPRTFKVLKVNPTASTGKYNSSLSAVLERNERSKLLELTTTQPTIKRGKYRLDFKGKVKVPSSKNFILKDPKDSQSLLFGKINDNTYILQVSYPLCLFEAFGVCLSSIDSKLMVN